MMISRSKLKFHETFQPEVAYLAKVCELAAKEYSGDKYAISEQTGIPTGKQKGKVEPHIKYANYMGLIDYTVEKGVYSLVLSQLGKEVFSQDCFLHENLTHWICHYCISREEVGAPQWAYIVHTGHSGYSQVNSSPYHLTKVNDLYRANVGFEEMFGVVRRSYIEGFFSDLNYINWDDGIEYIEHVERPELLFVYAYALFDSWERRFPNRKEITITELIASIELGKIFNLSEVEIDSILDELAYEGLIKVNRQLYPGTIIRLSSSSEIIPRVYSLLL